MARTPRNPHWLGIDLSQRNLVAALAPQCIIPADWRALPCAEFTNDAAGHTALADWVRAQLKAARATLAGAVVEATGPLALDLREVWPLPGTALSIVQPSRPKALARSLGVRDKTDAIDAAILAVYGALQRPAPTPPLPATLAQLRELTRLRQALQQDLTAQRSRANQLRGAATRQLMTRLIKNLRGEIKELERQIASVLAQDAHLGAQATLLKSMPGVGPVIAATLLSELGDLREYSRGQLIAAAGLYPRQCSSAGKPLARARLVKGGGGRVRRVLYLSALALCRRQGVLGALWLTLTERGKNGKAALAALMRKQLLMARAVLSSGQPYNPAHAARSQGARRSKSTGWQTLASTLKINPLTP